LFKSSQYCKGHRIRGELDDENEVFDALDDDSIATGGTVDCLVTIYEPASLQASLQITGEQSRFGPDYVGTTLAALFSTVGIRSSWDTFFVGMHHSELTFCCVPCEYVSRSKRFAVIDSEYWPNPKDYSPNEQLFQFALVRN
jgi:hypothetical protein